MTTEQLKEIFFMQSICLANYAKYCIKKNIVPELETIESLSNCTDVKTLLESNKIIQRESKKLDDETKG